MAFKQKSSPLNQFGFTSGNIGGAINSSSLAQQWAVKNGAPAPVSNIDPKTQAMMNVASQPLFGAGSISSNMAKQVVGGGGIIGALNNATKNKITGDSWKDNYWENKRKAEFVRGKAEVQAEIASRQKAPVVNTFDRAGMPIKADPNAIVQPPQPPPPVDITQNATAISNNDYNLRNMTSRQQTAISPKAFSNQGTIQNMYGQAMQGTFNRSVGSPFAQMADPLTGQYIDPTMDQSPDDPGPDPSLPQQPPVGVETPIAPVYDINNY